ncbi:dienelactone hydrolase family protein [Natronococcus sp. A-GB7]|uniref:alpha/beta hydrolase n=1 Tax=Natronococcus sp. A-GB7 TaxID=3037649 RepID=UPI00241E0BE4|nr:dienelactone hydrolase family protein [Natronococcus sp. A-GB7]MDG5819520.1 dienelactone hydrolase family protein [Natronococcus sp. A-GB7]
MTDSNPDGSGPHAEQPLVTSGAPAAAADVAVVACHGRGATAQGMVNLLEPIYRHGVAFLAPQAHRGSWYPRPATAPRAANEPGLSSSVESVEAALESAREIGIPAERVVFVGFSQGASVVAEFVRRRPGRYGGVFLLSGGMAGGPEDELAMEGHLEGTPAFVGYGADDSRIDLERVAETGRALEGAGADVTERRYPGVGHEVTDDEFEALGSLLESLSS